MILCPSGWYQILVWPVDYSVGVMASVSKKACVGERVCVRGTACVRSWYEREMAVAGWYAGKRNRIPE